MGDLVVARTSGVVMWDGRRHHVRRDATVAHRDHPLVLRNPRLWRDLVVHYDIESATGAGPVEQATAAPGERRDIPVPPAGQPSSPQRPPTSGPGSGVEAWRKYAADVTNTPAESWAELSRERVIELLRSEGVIEASNGG